MILEKALSQLAKRMTSGRFEPTQFDLDCFKTVVEWINRQKETVIASDQLYAKLYIHSFTHELLAYKDIKFAAKSMNNICDRELEYHTDKFRSVFLGQLFESYEIKMNFDDLPIKILRTDEQDAELEKRITEHPEHQKAILGAFSKEQLNKSLMNQVTEAYNKYRGTL